MHQFFKNVLFLMVLTFSMSIHANGVDNGGPEDPKSEKEASKENTTVDYKEVESVFMKIKRVDNILSPKKKLRKKKYTIA